MTAAELTAFIAEVRAEADQRLALLHAVDAATLPPELHADHAEALEMWTELRALTDADAVELHQAACEAAGLELTPAEARAVRRRQ